MHIATGRHLLINAHAFGQVSSQLEHDATWYPFGQFGWVVLAVSPLSSLCLSSLLTGRLWETEKPLT